MDQRLGAIQTRSRTNGLLTNACTHTDCTLTICLTSYTFLLPLSHNPRLQSALNKLCVCVFVQSSRTTGWHSDEQTVEYTYTFLIYSPPLDSTFHFCFSSCPFLPCVSICPLIITLLILPALSHRHTHTKTHICILQWKFGPICDTHLSMYERFRACKCVFQDVLESKILWMMVWLYLSVF